MIAVQIYWLHEIIPRSIPEMSHYNTSFYVILLLSLLLITLYNNNENNTCFPLWEKEMFTKPQKIENRLREAINDSVLV